jgi:hypothetical protein
MVAKIFRGAKPADIPVEQAARVSHHPMSITVVIMANDPLQFTKTSK